VISPQVPWPQRLTTLTMVIVILAALPALWAISHLHIQQQQYVRTAAVQTLGQAAFNTSLQVHSLIDRGRDLLFTLAEMPEIKAAADAATLSTCNQLLAQIGQRLPHYTNLSRTNRAGWVDCSSTPLPEPVYVGGSDNTLAALRGSFAVGEFRLGRLTGLPVLVLSGPVRASGLQVSGAVNVGLSMAWLDGYLGSLELMEGAQALVLDGQGRLLASFPSQPDRRGQPLDDASLLDALHHPASNAMPNSYHDGDGITWLYARAPLPEVQGGVDVVLRVPESRVLADLMRQWQHQRLMVGLALALGLMLTYAVALQLLLKPAQRLLRMTQALVVGDYQQRYDPPHPWGELRVVTRGLDVLAAALQRQQQERDQAFRQLGSEQQRLADILWATDAGTWEWRDSERRLYVNRRLASWLFTGTEAEDSLAERDWLALLHPQDRLGWQQAIATPLDQESPAMELQLRLRQADGHWLWLLARGRRVPQGAEVAITGIMLDISRHKQTEQALLEQGRLFQAVFEHAAVGLAQVTPEGVFMRVNAEMAQLLGRPAEELTQNQFHFEQLTHPEDSEASQALYQHLLGGGASTGHLKKRYLRPNGEVIWAEIFTFLQRDEAGQPDYFITAMIDLNEHKQTEAQLELAASVFAHAHEGMLITDAEARILEVNQAFSRITGYSREEAVGQRPSLLRSGRHDPSFYAQMWQELFQTGQWHGEIWNRRKDGADFLEAINITAVRDDTGAIYRFIAHLTDITEQRETSWRLQHVGRFDALTHLPNRSAFGERVRRLMAEANRRDGRIAVVSLDLDNFQAFNHRLGQTGGDVLLQATARRLEDALNEDEIAARLGGDEFALVLKGEHGPLPPRIDSLRDLVAQPLEVDGQPQQLTASIGCTLYPQRETLDSEQLLRQADRAAYEAKMAGGNKVHRFDSEREHGQRQRFGELERLRRALELQELTLFYQPKVNMRTGTVVGMEALIRWQHPERGLLSPAAFLPSLMHDPLDAEVGFWVLRTAFRQASDWLQQGLRLPISVNVSSYQMLRPDFIDTLQKTLATQPHLPPDLLELEVLETGALADIGAAEAVMAQARALGLKFALDDFGTGYSTLTYLKRLPAQLLKIDQSFVRDMLMDREDLAILEGIISLATAFHREVIAEGVETLLHGRLLLQLGCELGQGYGIARPMPATDVPAWIAHWQPDPSWMTTSRIHTAARPLIYAAVEHRAWVQAVEDFVQGNLSEPPELAQDRCLFQHWLNEHAQRYPGLSRQSLAAIDHLHTAVHQLGHALVSNRNPSGITPEQRQQQLHKLRQQCDELLGLLNAVLSDTEHTAQPTPAKP